MAQSHSKIIDSDNTTTPYYRDFSKYMLESNTSLHNSPPPPPITYEQFSQLNRDALSKVKLDVLKSTVREYGLPVSGNKSVLVERICTYFRKIKYAVRIQKIFRGFIAKCAYRLRGPARNNYTLCVNDSDFYTLDPLSEISHAHFFSYMDSAGFIYGFDLFSLINLFKRHRKIVNPYNREEFNVELTNRVFSLFKKIFILFPNTCVDKTLTVCKVRDSATVSVVTPSATGTASLSREISDVPVISREESAILRITQLQDIPINERIREVFMTIDQLGNYSQSNWFSDLSKLQYAKFYEYYSNWWRHRGYLSQSVKREICAIHSPFRELYDNYYNMTLEEYQNECLRIIECMVYTGSNVEYQRLGALHVLKMLTIVSLEARHSLPWLYESINF
jgi:hypothetical protein